MEQHMSSQSSDSSALSTAIKFIVAVVVGLILVGLLGIGAYYLRFVAPVGELAAITPAGSPAPDGVLVVPLANYAFVPEDLTIPAGTTLLFQNVDDDAHTVTFDNDEFPALGLQFGDTHEIEFDQVGVYQLYCEIHGSRGLRGMSATVRVVAPGALVQVPTAATVPTTTPRPTIVPLPSSALSPNGFGLFQDTLGRNDSFNLTVSHLSPPESGEYHAWLIGEGAALDLGTIMPDSSFNANLLYFSAVDENLLATYSGFLITVEAAGTAPGRPSPNVVFGGVLDPGLLGPTRQLLVASDGAPHQEGYATGLVEQAEELLLHAREINNAAQAGDVDSMDRHIEHLSALLGGKGSPDYVDFEGDGLVSDPGDGFGILNYAAAIIRQAQAAASSPGANEDQKRRAAELEVVANTIRELSNQLLVLRSAAHDARVASERTVFTTKILELTTQLLNGVDLNDNGTIEPVAGEGGVYTAYFQSQYLAAIGALAGESLPATPAAVTAEAEASPPPDTPGVAASTTPDAGLTTVIVHNFEFVPNTLTVKAGTTVVFLIQDSQHHAYHSFPNSEELAGFDSGLLSPGDQFRYTFDVPGTYTIRCREHLRSMVMTLVVEP
jgi:plastocyanin